MEIMLLGERFDARRALGVGLVNRVVPAAELDGAVAAIVAVAGRPARSWPSATPSGCCANRSARSLSEQLDAEAVSFGACSGTTDFAEGITAFLEKRPAEFGK